MGKTFVTIVDGSIDNQNLPKVGSIRIDVTGTANSAITNPSGYIEFNDSEAEWEGDNTVTIQYSSISGVNNNVKLQKTSKGLLLFTNKYNLSVINTSYAYGANVNFYDINQYCKKLNAVYVCNSEQTGDLSNLADLENLERLDIGGNKVTGDVSLLKNFVKLKYLSIANNKNISFDLNIFSNHVNLMVLSVNNTSVTGDLSNLANCTNLKSLNTNGSSVKGSISSLANIGTFENFTDWNLQNTWNSATLRPSSMKKITGSLKFKTATDTDNFIKNMAECSIGSDKIYYFQNSHRTSASDAAVQKLQEQGYTLNQLITD